MSATDQRIQVLLVAPADAVGGQAHAARQLVEGFAGHPRIAVSLQPISPAIPGPGPLRRVSNLRGVRTLLRPFVYLSQLFRRVPRADVVQVFCTAHLAFVLGALPAMLIARLFRKRLIVNYHDGRAAAHLRWWGPLPRWGLSLGHRLVVPSPFLRDVFAGAGLRAEIIPNVVDAVAFEYRPPRPLRHRLISARTLEELYRVENTLAAFRILQPEFPDLVLDVYGGGPQGPALRRLVEGWGLPQVSFHGEISHAAMPAVLAGGGIMLNSSRADNAPLFIIEAFAAGTPLVTTDAGGIPYMVEQGRTGLLVPVDNPEAMAAAVRQLLRDPEAALALAEAGRRQCEAYSWAAAFPRWESLYTELAADAKLAG